MRKALFILSLLLLALQPAFSQTSNTPITIQESRIRVGALLQEITRQSGINFSYNPRSIDPDQQVAFYVRDASLEETLEELASTIPVTYRIVENQIVLRRRQDEEDMNQHEPEYYTINGFINDQSSGESLIGATVFAHGTPHGTSTNGFGYYSLRLPEGRHKLEYGYLGFTSEVAEIDLKKNEKKDIGLRNIPFELPDVIIELPIKEILEKKHISKLELKPEELENMPEFGGESGLIRGLQSLPGMKTHSDGSAFFFVRGGEKDQNLIIIDDAPIYNPAHLFGFYSLVIPDFTRSISIYKNDIPVNLGDRLSSIIDIRTKDGNLNKLEFSGALNPLLNRFSLEGPIVKEKSSFFTSFRRSNFQWIYEQNNPNAELYFADFNFKWNYKINAKNRLFFTVISSADVLSNASDVSSNPAGIEWRNFAATFRWNVILSPKLFANTILYTGNYQYKLSSTEDVWHSGIGKLSLKSDFTYYNNPNFTTKTGFELHGYGFNPGKILVGPLSSFLPTIRQDYSRQGVLYYNADFRFKEKWRINAGARLSGWSNLGPAEYYTFSDNYEPLDTVKTGEGPYQTYVRIAPRTSMQYQIDSTSSLKLSYGIYHQYMQLISNSTSPFTSFEVWLPSSANIKPQLAEQLELSYLKYFPKPGLMFNSAIYHKKMRNQIDYEPHAQTLLNPFIEGELRFGQMRSYGLELQLKKERGRLNGWIAYTYSRTLRQTEEVNGGREYPAFHDRPHDFSLLLNYQIKRRLLLSAYWTSYTGSAFSSPTGFYTFNQNTVPIYGKKNNDRLPNYRRLDLALKFTLNKNPENRYQHSLTFSLYNALAHKNIVAVNFNKILQEDDSPIVRANVLGEQELVTTQADLIRFFPSLTYKFTL